MLRGVVMVLMTLDHTRDFFSTSSFDPRDVTDPALFLTRWITHFCAPVFVFLAGMSAGLRGQLDTTSRLSQFLLTRGFWLVLLEFTVVRVGWTFHPLGHIVFAQVIWALGVSMMALAALIHLPRPALAGAALAMVVGHNLLDGIRVDGQELESWLWMFVHQPGVLRAGNLTVVVLYPLVPWIGVMAAGYALAPRMLESTDRRRRSLVALGVVITMGFVALRSSNLYGDPEAWKAESTALSTILSFINCEKYPPSLLYVLMTLGPSLVALAAFDRASGFAGRSLNTIGRTPLFYYMAHIYFLHALALLVAWSSGLETGWLLESSGSRKPDGWGYSLPIVYAIAGGTIVALYPLCRRLASVKERRHEWWWSYL